MGMKEEVSHTPVVECQGHCVPVTSRMGEEQVTSLSVAVRIADKLVAVAVFDTQHDLPLQVFDNQHENKDKSPTQEATINPVLVEPTDKLTPHHQAPVCSG